MQEMISIQNTENQYIILISHLALFLIGRKEKSGGKILLLSWLLIIAQGFMRICLFIPLGKDLLSDKSNSVTFYTFNEGFGFITDSSKVAYDHKLSNFVLKEGKDTVDAEKTGKAYLQVLFIDYLKR